MRERLKGVWIPVLFAGLSFIFLVNSPLHPFRRAETLTDSSVFKTVAMMMERGYMPYRDTFDHKGPVLYIINYVGNMISDYRGVWVIELAFLFAVLIVLYKTARLAECGRVQSLLCVLISTAMLFAYFEGGNFVEEYAMLPIAAATYIFLDYFINNRISRVRLVLCGAAMAVVLLLRANMIAVWIVFALAVLVRCIIEKTYDRIGYFLVWFLVGAAIVIVPIMIWLAVNGALGAFWECYIIFNMRYSSAEGGISTLDNRIKVLLIFAKAFPVIAAFAASVILAVVKDRFTYIVYTIYLALSLLLISMSGSGFAHYGMVLIPAYIFPIARIASLLSGRGKRARIIVNVALICCVLIFAGGKWYNSVRLTLEYYEKRSTASMGSDVLEVCDIVQSYTAYDEPISVYGNYDIIYVVSEREHATRYSYQFPIGEVDPDIMNDYWEELKSEQPKVIVVQEDRFDDAVKGFLTENGYELVWNEEPDGPYVFVK